MTILKYLFMVNFDIESHRATFKVNAKTYRGTFAYCTRPTCDCTRGEFTFFLKHRQEGLVGDEYQFSLELEECRFESAVDSRSETFASLLMSNMTEEDWEILLNSQIRKRRLRIKDDAPESIEFHFSDNTSELTSFLEVFPHATLLAFRFENKNYFAIDYHHALPNCDCSSIVLNVEHHEGTKIVALFDYDFKTGKSSVADSNINRKKAKKMLYKFREQNRNINDFLEKRNIRLKEIFQSQSDNPVKRLISSAKSY